MPLVVTTLAVVTSTKRKDVMNETKFMTTQPLCLTNKPLCLTNEPLCLTNKALCLTKKPLCLTNEPAPITRGRRGSRTTWGGTGVRMRASGFPFQPWCITSEVEIDARRETTTWAARRVGEGPRRSPWERDSMKRTVRHFMILAVLAGSGGVATLAACDKKDDPAVALAPSASALAPSVSEGMKGVKFTIEAAGKSAIDMPAPIEHIKADTTAAAGSLDVDLANLANTRGEVKIDLNTLKTHTFDSDGQNTAQTEHAHTWLEIAEPPEKGDGGPSTDMATPEQRDANRWVLFAIRSIDGLSAPDVTKVAAATDGPDDVREVSLNAHGDFLLHQHKVPKDATLAVRFHYPRGAAATSKPTRIDIATKTPLHVVLAQHDVKPRDAAGRLKQASAQLLGKVAETADISLDLHATPTP